jgi:hypothetical protein
MPVDFKFEYGNPFASKKDSIPIFLRHQGVSGSLSLKYDTGEVDKVKITLKGRQRI